jgi:MraZ protein
MFFGEFNYKLDEKGRVAVPPRFRKDLKDGVVLAPGAEKCINIYPLAEWRKMAGGFTGGSLTQNKLRRLNRFIFATAFNVTVDGQGRVALPIPLREYAEIGEEVVIAGVNAFLEVWDQALWEEEKTISQEQAWQIIESLEKRDGTK